MAKVSDLKERARLFEQQGEFAKALTVYCHILSHLENTPAILKEIPLYVKVGDLSLKLGDAATAAAMYERAADHYTELGAGKNVVSLCLKILRARPDEPDVLKRYAVKLLTAGHAEGAHVVLQEHAERAKLPHVVAVLVAGAGQSPARIRRAVEDALAELNAPPRATPHAVTPPPAPPEPVRPARGSPVSGVMPPEQVEWVRSGPTPKPPPRRVRPPTTKPVAAPPAPTPAATAAPPDVPPTHPPAPVGVPGLAGDKAGRRRSILGGSKRSTGPRRMSTEIGAVTSGGAGSLPAAGSLFAPRERRSSGSKGWVVLAAVVVVVGTIGALGALRLIPVTGLLGSDGGARGAVVDSTPGPAPLPAVASDATTDTSAGGDTLSPSGAGVVAAPPATPAATTAAPPAPDTTPRRQAPARPPVRQAPPRVVAPPPVAAPRDTPRTAAPTPNPDSVAAAVRAVQVPDSATRSEPAPRTVRVPPGTSVPGPLIVVEGLPVDQVTQTSLGGRVGFQLVHRLSGGDELVLTAVPVPAGTDTSGVSEVRVTTVPGGDTSVGSVRFWGFVVNARARLEPDSLTRLLRRLVRAQPVQ